jgi:DNA mismatch repair protein MutS
MNRPYVNADAEKEETDWFTIFLESKKRHPGMILLIRDGDAYHMFGTDAEIVANVCDLSVFPAHHGESPWAGFPGDMLEGCLKKLLKAGHRVAICDQIEPLECKGAEVNRIVAPGPDRRVVSPDGRIQGQPKTLAYIGRDGTWKQTPWMFD